jgi:hypothetical protein
MAVSSKYRRTQDQVDSYQERNRLQALEDKKLEDSDLGTKNEISQIFYLTFDRHVSNAVDMIDPRINDAHFTVWAGKRGTAKSTMGIVECFAIMQRVFAKEQGIDLRELFGKKEIEFPIDNMAFEVDDLIKLLKTVKGEPVFWEEGGTSAYSRNFKKKGNINTNLVMQMFRKQNIPLIGNFQNLTLFDNHARMQIDVCFWMKSVMYKSASDLWTRKYMTPYTVQLNLGQDPYFTPELVKLHGNPNYSELLNVPVPSEAELMRRYGVPRDFMKAYQERKSEYYDSLGVDEEEDEDGTENEIRYTANQIEMLERKSIAFDHLVTKLNKERKITQVDISAMAEVNRNTLVSWIQKGEKGITA